MSRARLSITRPMPSVARLARRVPSFTSPPTETGCGRLKEQRLPGVVWPRSTRAERSSLSLLVDRRAEDSMCACGVRAVVTLTFVHDEATVVFFETRCLCSCFVRDTPKPFFCIGPLYFCAELLDIARSVFPYDTLSRIADYRSILFGGKSQDGQWLWLSFAASPCRPVPV